MHSYTSIYHFCMDLFQKAGIRLHLLRTARMESIISAVAVHEGISLLPEEGPIKGWCLVAYRGFPLGWAKGNNMTLKNKYYPGWRLQ